MKKINIQRLFSFLRYLPLCPDFLVLNKNGLIRKLRLISKFLTSQVGPQIITKHILSNISRSKCNQTMKFNQLIEYDKQNIFLEKSYTKCAGEASRRSFYKKLKLSISLD